MNKEKMKLIQLDNPDIYNLSFVGIGFQKGDNYLLVVFKDREIVFNRFYKSLRGAKIGFAKNFNDKKGIKPKWADIEYKYSFAKKKKKNGRKRMKFIKNSLKKGNITEGAVLFILSRTDEEIKSLKEKDVAESLNTKLDLLSLAFKSLQKISLSKFILREKLYRAYFLLRKYQDISIPELAGRLGFVSTDQFEALFENYIYLKPRRFQQILKQENKKAAQKDSFPGKYETLRN